MHKKIRHLFHLILLLGLSGLIFSCAQLQEYYPHKIQSPQSQFSVLGYASIDQQHGENRQQKILNASKASKLDAYKTLAEYLHGVMLKSATDIDYMQVSKDIIASHVEGLVKGAKVSRSYYEGDIYITELVINLDSLSDLSQQKEASARESRAILTDGNQVYY